MINFHPLLSSSNTPGDYVQFQYLFRSISRASLYHLHRFQMVNFANVNFVIKKHILLIQMQYFIVMILNFRFSRAVKKSLYIDHVSQGQLDNQQCSSCQVFILCGRISNITFNQNITTIWINGVLDYTFMLL